MDLLRDKMFFSEAHLQNRLHSAPSPYELVSIVIFVYNVGYCVLPLYIDGRVPDEVYSLPVFKNLGDNYVSQATDCSQKQCHPVSKTLFRVNTRLASTLYTNDPYLSKFLASCSFEPVRHRLRKDVPSN